MPRRPESRSALTFQLALRRYALPLDLTSGVRDLGHVRRIPGAPEPWYGLTDWGDGRVLNVLDLPMLLRDEACDKTRSIVRLRAPHEDLALYVPAHLGLGEWVPPPAAVGAPFTALNAGADAVHWIDLDALLRLAATRTA